MWRNGAVGANVHLLVVRLGSQEHWVNDDDNVVDSNVNGGFGHKSASCE